RRRREFRSVLFVNRFSAKHTRSWRKGGSRPPWPMSMSATIGKCISPIPCAGASTSINGASRSCTRKRRPITRGSPQHAASFGRAYKITSNSWEYTGDGHALAYVAGAELIDMEFVQFHPTGMVWPPSVCGILVTEGVRGEGGILTNKDGRRFMFDSIPENYRA